jgi:DNA-binding beta-propeller fold protein YncE
MTTERKSARTAALVVAVGACLAWAAPAGASLGDLSYEGCVADTDAQGCVDVPFAPLQQPRELATSPDGKSVYLVTKARTIAQLGRNPATGRLRWGGCFHDTGAQGCADAPGEPLLFMADVAVSPNGRSVYGVTDRTIVHFFRGEDGQLAWDGCLARSQGTGCGQITHNALDNGRAIAVSPDGSSVYAAASSLGSVAHFSAFEPDGQIAYVGCLASQAHPPGGSSSGCGDILDDPLSRAEAVAVSPDGRSVYMVGFAGNAIGHFARNPESGNLGWRGCLNNDGSQGCDNLLDAPLGVPTGVEVSADGRSVYVISIFAGTVSHFLRNPMTGELTWEGCLSNDGSNHCTDVPGNPFRAMQDLAVSPDGTSLYVTADIGLVAHLARDPADGRLSWAGCYGPAESEDCVRVAGSLTLPTSVAVTADSRSVYVADALGNAVTHLRRELATPAPPPPGGSPGPEIDRVAPAITSVTVSRRRGRATFRYELSESAAVAVEVQRARRKRWVPAGRTLARTGAAGPNRLRLGGKRLRPGAYRARFTATDAAGNRSRPRTVRFRIVRR